MKIITVIGARPQFVKAATISRILQKDSNFNEIIVHTGQHYDKNMSQIFFDELQIPQPDFNLDVGSETHAKQTALMLERLERVFVNTQPDLVLVYGDTNSTVAASLAASKLQIKIAHIEAGLRSFNMSMPEEINRIVTDHISTILYAPTVNAKKLLTREGLAHKTILSGDVMYDALLYNLKLAKKKYTISQITPIKEYYLATIHRPSNTDSKKNLRKLFTAFSKLDLPVILPLHPRTKKFLDDIKIAKNIYFLDPVGPLKMLLLIKHCTKVLTDSGGLQKEAYLQNKPCVTLREETEWTETLNNNWNFVVGSNIELILDKVHNVHYGKQKNYFGNGHAAAKIVSHLSEFVL